MAPFPRSTESHTQATWRPLNRNRLLKAFTFAFAGISYAWRNEPNFRIEVGIAVLVFLLSLWLGISPIAILIMSGLVLALELLNSALEATINLISPDFHPLAKLAKDAAAGAVLLTAFVAVVVGLIVLGPALLRKLGLL